MNDIVQYIPYFNLIVISAVFAFIAIVVTKKET